MRWPWPWRWGPARVEDWPAPAPPVHPIEQYWVLALLLHAWVVLAFGTLQGGTARPGEGVWGSLTVALVGPPGQGDAPTQAAEQGALAPMAQGRQGRAESRLPDAAVTAPDLPEATEPQAGPPAADEPAAPKAPTVPPEPAPPADIDPPPQAVPPPAPVPVQPAPEPAAAPMAPVAPVAEAPEPAEPSKATLADAASVLGVTRRGETLAAAAVPHALPEVARPVLRVPAAHPAPAPVPAASAPSPAAVPAPLAPPVAAAAAPLAPAPAPSAPTPVPVPVVMRQLATEVLPALARGPAFNAALTPVRPAARMPEVQALAAADRVGPPRRPVVQGKPEATTAAAPAASGPAAGDVRAPLSATAPAPPASAAKLILELPRGGAMAAQGVRGAIQVVPPPPERKSKLGEAMDKAAKTDCREAYQKNGLLAVVPLVVDAVRDKGCQW